MEKLKIREDRTAVVLRKLAKEEMDPRVARRLLAIANALGGVSRAEAAKSAGMDRQSLRDWIIRYSNAVPASATASSAPCAMRDDPSRFRMNSALSSPSAMAVRDRS